MHLQIPVVVAALSLLVGSAAPLCAQGLGALARKAEETRKTAKKGTKVYTNADAGNVQAATVSMPASKSGSAAPADASGQGGQTPGADASQDKGEQKDQTYWSNRMKALQAQVERDIQFAEAIQTRINILAADLVNNDQGQRPAIEENRNRAMAELARLQKAIVDGRKAIADLEEEARRGGVPAGWLR